MRSPRVGFDAVASGQGRSHRPPLAMHEYPLFWMYMQPGELVYGRYAIRLMQAARCSLVTMLLLTMGSDEPSGQHRASLIHADRWPTRQPRMTPYSTWASIMTRGRPGRSRSGGGRMPSAGIQPL